MLAIPQEIQAKPDILMIRPRTRLTPSFLMTTRARTSWTSWNPTEEKKACVSSVEKSGTDSTSAHNKYLYTLLRSSWKSWMSLIPTALTVMIWPPHWTHLWWKYLLQWQKPLPKEEPCSWGAWLANRKFWCWWIQAVPSFVSADRVQQQQLPVTPIPAEQFCYRHKLTGLIYGSKERWA